MSNIVKTLISKAKFIGITGYARSGKDETAKILSSIGFTNFSLADELRKGIYKINPYVVIEKTDPHYQLFINKFSSNVIRLQQIVDELGWDEAKKIKEVRRLLQYYGTEGGREIFGDDVWTNIIDKKIKTLGIKKVTVSDVRFLNELAWTRSKSGNLIIKIKRKGVGPVNGHVSDNGIPDELCDIVISNDGTLKDLKAKLI